MATAAGTSTLTMTPSTQPGDALPTMSFNHDDYSSQEDDAPTRVFTKRATFSHQASPALARATTKEREIESENDQSRYPTFFVRDFGDKVSPGYDDVVRQSGLRTDSTNMAVDTSPAEPDRPEITLMEIMHNWKEEVQDEEFIATINIYQKKTSSAAEPEGRMTWIHVEDHLPSLERLEKFFRSHLAKRVEHFVDETTISLLRRVKTTLERQLGSGTLGRFLIPGVVRYSARSSETGNEDHPCFFLSFPYFALGNFGKRRTSSRASQKRQKTSHPKTATTLVNTNGNVTTDLEGQKHNNTPQTMTDTRVQNENIASTLDPQYQKYYHPPRTLLQSKYRLESTKKRDEKQSILSPTPAQVQECISRPSRSTARFKQDREKLYIPQLWTLSLSGDVMLTCGPISLEDLCSSALIRRNFSADDSNLQHSIVRFIFENDSGRDEFFIYPADRCEWFYGLLNKQRKVEKTLGIPNLGVPASAADAIDPLVHTLFYRKNPADQGQEVTCNNWLIIQSEHKDNHLDLFMVKRNVPQVNVVGPSVNQTPNTTATTMSTNPQQHVRSNSLQATAVVNPSSPTTPTSPRFLMIAPRDPRGRSGSSSARSISPMSIASTAMPQEYASFLEWPFLEEVTQSVKNTRTPNERVNAWLAKILNVICRSHCHDIEDAMKPAIRTFRFDSVPRLNNPIGGSDIKSVEAKFFSANSPDIFNGKPKIVSSESQKIFRYAREIARSFVPKRFVHLELDPDNLDVGKTIFIYWGLVQRILGGIIDQGLNESDLKLLSQKLEHLLSLAKQIHRGVWKMTGDKNAPEKVTTVESAVVYMPLANAFEDICDLFLDVIVFMSDTQTVANRSADAFEQSISRGFQRILQDFGRAQKFLIQAGEEGRYQKSLGPIVTPEGITLLLLRRLGRGVYHDGSINLIDVYERIVEQLSTKVEGSATRFLLLEINRVAEEIEIVLETFIQQQSFLKKYKAYLDPKVFDKPSSRRKLRFEYEQQGIERITTELDERIKDCRELKERVQRLADQNVQLVEGGQDAINQKLMLFTVITIIFLPPSFVTGFFGMNLQGINGTNYHVGHFWKIATPLTAGLLIISLVVLYQQQLIRSWQSLRAKLSSDDEDDD